jgi:hypothetical protein
MTHYSALVVLPPETDPVAGVAAALAPFEEGDEYRPESLWDWYAIGWNGEFGPNVSTPADVLDVLACAPYDPYTVIAGEMVSHSVVYHNDLEYPECFEIIPGHGQMVRRILRSVDPRSVVVTVDLHR